MAWVSTLGLMVEHITVHGKTIICMAMEFIHGVMVENMKENIIWIKSMVLAFIFGLMEGGMKVIGRMENSMEVESTCCQTELQK